MTKTAVVLGLTLPLTALAQSQAPGPASTPAAPGVETPGKQNIPPPNEPEHRGGFVPGQKRQPGDPAQIARGKILYGINCRGCHGADLRGGDLGGPNLLRSQVALSDLHGEQIVPIIHGARQSMGMPAIGLNDADAHAVAAYVRSVVETIEGQGAPPSAGRSAPSILVGNAAAGEAFFTAQCSRCHAANGDLSRIASKFRDPKQLQNNWLSGGARREEEDGARARTVSVQLTFPSGETVSGKLVRQDDFLITLQMPDGAQRTFRRDEATKAVIEDPLKVHRDLLPTYSDKNIHDVTAYLETLK